MVPLDWALQVQGRSNNKATCALANMLARICYAMYRDYRPFDEAAHLGRKETASALWRQPAKRTGSTQRHA